MSLVRIEEYWNARFAEEEEGRRDNTSRTAFRSEGLRNLLKAKEAMSVKVWDG